MYWVFGSLVMLMATVLQVMLRLRSFPEGDAHDETELRAKHNKKS